MTTFRLQRPTVSGVFAHKYISNFEHLGHLPGEIRVSRTRGVAEVPVARSLFILGLEHVELSHEHPGAAVEVGFDDGQQILVRLAARTRAVRVNKDREGGRHANGIGELLD